MELFKLMTNPDSGASCSMSETCLVADRCDALQAKVSELETERDDYKLRFSSYYALEDRVVLLREALASLLGRHTLSNGLCTECGALRGCQPGCEIGLARDALSTEHAREVAN